MVRYVYKGYGITNDNGVATLDHDANGNPISHSYVGTGAGKIDMVGSLDNPIEQGSFVSGIYPISDCNFYDGGVIGNNKSTQWSFNTTYITRTITTIGTIITNTDTSTSRVYSANKPTSSSYSYDWQGDYIIEFDLISREGSVGLQLINRNNDIVGVGLASIGATDNNHVRIVNLNGVLTVYVDDVQKYTSSINIGNHAIRFTLSGQASFTYKDFEIHSGLINYITLDAPTKVIESGDSVTLTAQLFLDGVIGTNQDIKFYDGDTLLDTVTAVNGVAEYTYTGTGGGLKNFTAKYSSIVSETFSIFDCTFYDKGILDDPQTNDMWGAYSSSATLTRTATHSVLKESSSSNTIAVINENNVTKYFNTDVCLELDFKIVDGAFNNSVIDIRNSNSSIMNGLIANQIGIIDHNWHHLKIDIRHPNIEIYTDNGSTPYTKPMDANLTSFRLGLWTGGDITELHFKDVKVYPI